MSKFFRFISRHIPETVCICVTATVFVVLTVYAIVLENRASSLIGNGFDDAKGVNISEIDAESMSDEDGGDGKYYVIGNGKKYHVSGCSYIKEDSVCTEVSSEDIEESGYEPCSRCIK